MADISIITLTREHPDYVARLSDSLDAQEGLDALEVERILVNNGAAKGLKEWETTTRLGIQRGWMVVEPGYNTSFSEGNNMGAKVATGKWLLLLNDDLELYPRAIAEAWKVRDQAHLLGMLILHRNGSINHAGSKLLPWPDHLDRGRLPNPVRGGDFRKTEAVTFAAVLMRQDLYHQLGGLDEQYLYGFEDTDFCCKALEAGKLIGVAMEAVALHDECGTRVRNGGYDKQNAQLFRTRWMQGRIAPIVQEYWRG